MKTIKIKELGIEVRPKQEQNGVAFKDIKIPTGWRLIKATEIMKFWDNKKFRNVLLKENCSRVWFYVENLEIYKEIYKKKIYKKKYIARFNGYSDGALLYCGRDPGYSNSGLGVIFVGDIKMKAQEFNLEEIKRHPVNQHRKEMIFDCEECGKKLELPYFIIWRRIFENKKTISTICCEDCKNKIGC